MNQNRTIPTFGAAFPEGPQRLSPAAFDSASHRFPGQGPSRPIEYRQEIGCLYQHRILSVANDLVCREPDEMRFVPSMLSHSPLLGQKDSPFGTREGTLLGPRLLPRRGRARHGAQY